MGKTTGTDRQFSYFCGKFIYLSFTDEIVHLDIPVLSAVRGSVIVALVEFHLSFLVPKK